MKLLSIREKILNSGKKEPDFMMIIVASGNAYTTKEGIHIVPINMLRA